MVLVGRQDYIKKMNNILSDKKKFTIVNLQGNILSNFAVNQEKYVDKVLKKLVEANSMTEKKRENR